MSAVWVTLTAVFCICHTAPVSARAKPESSEVQWRHLGGSITIQCNYEKSDQNFFNLRKGLKKDSEILFRDNKRDKITIAKEFQGRLQVSGAFPRLDILIQNLTLNDTGPYWCIYKDFYNSNSQVKDGTGSVLLVMKDNEDPNRTCDSSNQKLILVSVVISAAVLLSIILGILIWIIKTKAVGATVKTRHTASNDVYEDMRGTLRR